MESKTAPRALATLIVIICLALALITSTQAPASAGSRHTCPSETFCVWTAVNFEGTRYEFDDVDDYNLIAVDPIRSAFNNRSKRSYLNEDSGSSTTWSCFGAYDYDSSLSTWQLHANSVFLSTYTNCPA